MKSKEKTTEILESEITPQYAIRQDIVACDRTAKSDIVSAIRAVCKNTVEEATAEVQYPTGFTMLDYANGQRINVDDPEHDRVYSYDSVGIVDGSVNIFIGRSGSGKSTLIKQAAANIVKRFPRSIIIEDSIEGGIMSNRNEMITGFTPAQLKERLFTRNTGVSCESFYSSIYAIYKEKTSNPDLYKYDTGLFDSNGDRVFKYQPTIYILDSLAMLMPEKLTQEEEISGQMSTTAAAKLIASTFRRIIPLCKGANIIVFVVNHITTMIDINPYQRQKTQNLYLRQGETTPGGVTPMYLANNVFRLDDNTKLSEDKELGIAGNFVTVSLVKSRTNRAGRSVDLVFNQDFGFDNELSLFVMLKKMKKICGAGAYLYLEGYPEKKFAQKNVKRLLREDPEFCRHFVEACYDILHRSLDYKEGDEYLVNENSYVGIGDRIMSYNIPGSSQQLGLPKNE